MYAHKDQVLPVVGPLKRSPVPHQQRRPDVRHDPPSAGDEGPGNETGLKPHRGLTYYGLQYALQERARHLDARSRGEVDYPSLDRGQSFVEDPLSDQFAPEKGDLATEPFCFGKFLHVYR